MDEKQFRDGLNIIADEFRTARDACAEAEKEVPRIRKERKELLIKLRKIKDSLDKYKEYLPILRRAISDCDAQIARLENDIARLDPEEDSDRINDLQQQIDELEAKRSEHDQLEQDIFSAQQQLEQEQVNLSADYQNLTAKLNAFTATYNDHKRNLENYSSQLERGIRDYKQTHGALSDAAATKFNTDARNAKGEVSQVLTAAEVLRRELPGLLRRYKAVFDTEGREREIER